MTAHNEAMNRLVRRMQNTVPFIQHNGTGAHFKHKLKCQGDSLIMEDLKLLPSIKRLSIVNIVYFVKAFELSPITSL